MPYNYIGKKVKVLYASIAVKIYYQYTLIASHRHIHIKYRYNKDENHLPHNTDILPNGHLKSLSNRQKLFTMMWPVISPKYSSIRFIRNRLTSHAPVS